MNSHFHGIAIALLIVLLAACQSPDPAQTEIAAQETASVEAAQPQPTATAVPTKQPPAAWEIVSQLTPENETKFAAFLNETVGFASCGPNSPISLTIDAGQSWIQPALGRYCPSSVDFVDSQSLWLCSQFGLFSSKDGGQSMGQMYSPYSGCQLLNFADDTYGWSSFEQKLSATTDGALRWLEVETPEEMTDIAAIFLRDAENGFVLDYNGVLFSTTDAGKSWSSIDLGLADSGSHIVKMDARPSAAIHFTDEENGFLILNLAIKGTGVIVALHTDDGGQSWGQHHLPLNPGSVYLSRDGQYLTVTEHGGEPKVTIFANQTNAGS